MSQTQDNSSSTPTSNNADSDTAAYTEPQGGQDGDRQPAPGVWDSVIGQPHALEALKSWAASPTHAYLFVGPVGSGKLEAARAFAAAIQSGFCEGSDEAKARQARLALSDSHADVEVHEPVGRQLLVEAVKSTIIPAVFRKPVEGERRIIIIDRFHDANDAAAIALLKTVEEPPPSAIIILVSESVPVEHVAIASRCVRVDFSQISHETLTGWLAERNVTDPQTVNSLIEAANGDLRRLELLLTDEGFAKRCNAWTALVGELDGTGAKAGELTRNLLAMIDDAAEALKVRHSSEIAELEEHEEHFGTRGSGRKALIDKHKRELRKHRTTEIVFGLRVLTQYYRQALLANADQRYVDAVTKIRNANSALIRNPNENLLLHNLFWNLPSRSL